MKGLLIVLVVSVAAVSGDSRCNGRGGTCKFTYLGCNQGSFTSNLCSGAWNRKCCIRPSSSSSTGTGYNCYGDVTRVATTGASQTTANQDRLNYAGVAASNKMVDVDQSRLNLYKASFVQAGQANCIHPALIAALASRESRAGSLLKNGYGDGGNAYGILQCDIQHSGLNCKKYTWNSYGHINMMVKDLLVPYIKRVKAKHPSWTPEQQMRGGVAAYNVGVGNVRTISGMDRGTTGDDYSSDIIARAQRLISAHGW